MDKFKQLCEKKLLECNDTNNAPFGMTPQEGYLYLKGKQDTLNWVLEMLPLLNK